MYLIPGVTAGTPVFSEAVVLSSKFCFILSFSAFPLKLNVYFNLTNVYLQYPVSQKIKTIISEN